MEQEPEREPGTMSELSGYVTLAVIAIVIVGFLYCCISLSVDVSGPPTHVSTPVPGKP